MESPLVVLRGGRDLLPIADRERMKKLYDKDFVKNKPGIYIPSLNEINKMAPYSINDRNEILLNMDRDVKRDIVKRSTGKKKLDKYVDIVIPRQFRDIHKQHLKSSKKSNKTSRPTHITFRKIQSDANQIDGGGFMRRCNMSLS